MSAELSLPVSVDGDDVIVRLGDQDDTDLLGRILGLVVERGDVIFLEGDLGAGKTTLSRGIIQQFFNDPALDVQSPSFLLCLTYADEQGSSDALTLKVSDADSRHTVSASSSRIPGVVIHHVDPYRLKVGQIAGVIDFSEVFAKHISIIEWPDRLGATIVDPAGPQTPTPPRLVITISGSGSQGASRIATLSPTGPAWRNRVAAWGAAGAITATAPPPPTTVGETLRAWPTVAAAVTPSSPPSEWLVLGIESSCDDTAAAVVRGDGRVVSHVVASQRGLHERFGGVKPDVARRAHAAVIWRVVMTALAEAAADVAAVGAASGGSAAAAAGAAAGPWTDVAPAVMDAVGTVTIEDGSASAAVPDAAAPAAAPAACAPTDVASSVGVPVDFTAAAAAAAAAAGHEGGVGATGAAVPPCVLRALRSVPLTAVAATVGPGLALCLEVGVSAALTVAAACGVPFVPVHHMEAHALVAALPAQGGGGAPAASVGGTGEPPGSEDGSRGGDLDLLSRGPVSLPAAFVLCSGGHNMVVAADAIGSYRIMGSTLDDSLGELFDKTGRILGIAAVPAGPHVETLATKGDASRLLGVLPRPLAKTNDPVLRGGAAFSFAGLKAAVRGVVSQLLPQLAPPPKAQPHAKRKRPRADEAGPDGGVGVGVPPGGEGPPPAKRVAGAAGGDGGAGGIDERRGGGEGDGDGGHEHGDVAGAAAAVPTGADDDPTKPLVVSIDAAGAAALNYAIPPLGAAADGEGDGGADAIVAHGEGPGGRPVHFTAAIEQVRADIAAAAQARAVEHLEERVTRALMMIQKGDPSANPPIAPTPLKTVVVAGGVAANKTVRAAMERAAQAVGAPLVCPPLRLCTDNGVMVAYTGVLRLSLGLAQRPPALESVSRGVELRPRWPLGPRDPRCIRSGSYKGSTPLPGKTKF